jgi:hypothetical protein
MYSTGVCDCTVCYGTVGNKIVECRILTGGPGSSVGMATELRARQYGDRIPVGAGFFAHVQTEPRAHPAFCTMGTMSFPG